MSTTTKITIAVLCVLFAIYYNWRSDKNKVIIELGQGKIQGLEDVDKDNGTFYSFLSIPYAKPPLGELRFRDPLPPENWDATRDGTKDMPICPQINYITNQYEGQEDCLYLNVHTPQLQTDDGSTKLPVMFFIHGGGFLLGSGRMDHYGPRFLMPRNVVLVTINYRLGELGFISSSDPDVQVYGNMGLKDQNMALRWVQKNIAKFGGDPNSVTVFGESAGGASAHYHVLSSMSNKLFHRAIAMSGTACNAWAMGHLGSFEIKAKQMNIAIDNKAAMVKAMQSIDPESLMEEHKILKFVIPINRTFENSPVAEIDHENAFITRSCTEVLESNEHNKVPFILGYTDKDGLFLDIINRQTTGKPYTLDDIKTFIPYIHQFDDVETEYVIRRIKEFYFDGEKINEQNRHNMYDLATDVYFFWGIVKSIQYHLLHNDEVYLYKFGLDSKMNYFKRFTPETSKVKGASHIDDLGYLFNNIFSAELTPGSREDKLIDLMTKLWTNFAKSGKPTEKDSEITWQPVEEAALNYIYIKDKPEIGINPDSERYEFWENLDQRIDYETDL